VGIATFLAVAAAVVFAVEAGWPSLIGIAALVLMAADIVFTVSCQVPLNKIVQSWTDAAIPANWWAVRDRWAAPHRVRAALCTLAYAALLAAVIMTWAGDSVSNPSEADHTERGVVRAQAPELVWIRSSTASGLAARL
jgi:hypothetical protein